MPAFRHRRRGQHDRGKGCCRKVLAAMRNGERGTVASDRIPQELLEKLFPMGLTKGGEVEVLSGGTNNPFLIKTGGTRIMVDWETANKIPIRG
jgi:Fe2+ transport system protein FeoA